MNVLFNNIPQKAPIKIKQLNVRYSNNNTNNKSSCRVLLLKKENDFIRNLLVKVQGVLAYQYKIFPYN